MKLSLIKPIIAILLTLLIFNPAIAGTLYKWTDENGVMHISTQPPPEDIEHEKSKYKNTPDYNQNRARKLKFKPQDDDYYQRQQERRERLEREKRERAGKREQEAKESKGKREMEAAKRNYESLESQKEIYRAHYHDATTSHYRNYWYRKMKEVDEARSKYIRLKNKYGE